MNTISLLSSIIPVLSILGFSNVVTWKKKLPNSLTIFISAFTILLLQTICLIFGYIQYSTLIILIAGVLLFLITTVANIRHIRNDTCKETLQTNTSFICLYIVSVSMVFLLHDFHGSDQYHYWAIIDKFVYMLNHLPTSHMQYAINSQHLSYTPGLAAFHYLFYYSSGQYSILGGHIAQNVLLFSTLIIFFDAKQKIISLSKIALAILILSIGDGFFFASMGAGHILVAAIFAITYLIVQSSVDKGKWLIIAAPILSLYLLKQIGIFFSVVALIALFACEYRRNQSNTKLFIYQVCMLSLLFTLKSIWVWHYQQAGFPLFAAHVPLSRIIQAITPFGGHFQTAQWMTIKAIFLASIDKNHIIPYCVVYAIIFLLSRKIYRSSLIGKAKAHKDAIKILVCLAASSLCYLVLIYLQEVFTFNGGGTFRHMIGFSRYFNYSIIPLVMFVMHFWYDDFLKKRNTATKKLAKISLFFLTITPVFVLAGLAEHAMKKNQFAEEIKMAKKLNQSIMAVDATKNPFICIAKFQTKKWPELFSGIILQFYVFPSHIKYCQNSLACANECDFVFVNNSTAVNNSYQLIRAIPYRHHNTYLYKS